jgi:hypothetical protein
LSIFGGSHGWRGFQRFLLFEDAHFFYAREKFEHLRRFEPAETRASRGFYRRCSSPENLSIFGRLFQFWQMNHKRDIPTKNLLRTRRFRREWKAG